MLSTIAQCPLAPSHDTWQQFESQHTRLVEAHDARNWEEALEIARPGFEQATNPRDREFFRYHLARALIGLGDGQSAVPIMTDSSLLTGRPESGLEFFQYKNASLGLEFIGRFTDPQIALNFYQGLKPFLDDPACDSILDRVNIYRNIGELYFYQMDNFFMADHYFDIAIDIWIDSDRDSSKLPPLLYDLAVVKSRKFQHAIALDYIGSAQSIGARYPEKYSPSFLMNCQNIVALIFVEWHKYDEGINALKELVQMRTTDDNPYKYEHLLGEYWNLAIAYTELEAYDDAEAALQEVLRINELKREHFESPVEMMVEMDRAHLLLDQSLMDSASALISEISHNMDNRQAIFKHYHYYYARLYTRYLTIQQDFETAAGLLESIILNQDSAVTAYFKQRPNEEIELWKLAGNCRLEMYGQKPDKNLLVHAMHHYLTADSLLTSVRTTNPWRPSSQYIAEHFRGLYDRMLQCIADLNAIESSPQYLENAFDIMERNKALLLNESRERNRYISFGDLDEDTIRMIQDMQMKIVEMNRSIRSKSALEQADERLKLDRVQTEYFDLLGSINDGYIEQTRSISLGEWNRQCRGGKRAWVQFFMGDSSIFILGASGRDLAYKTVELTDDLLEDLENVTDHVHRYGRKEGYTAFTHSARALYKALIPEAIRKSQYREVIIIPDGRLSFLPFEVLLTDDDIPSAPDYRRLPYWVNDVSISYGMSAALWEQNTVRRSDQLLSTNYKGEYQGLPASAAESEILASVWPGTFVDNRTKTGFFSGAASSGILHFATHAEAGLEEGRENRIRICDNFSDPSCTIEGYELLGLDLDGRLVILNACETNYGLEKKGEGVFSLSRDFAMAGVSSILSNGWKVQDKAAQEIVVSTMRNWKRQSKLSRALSTTKRQYIADSGPESAHPYFWAGTIIIGDSQLAGTSLFSALRFALILIIAVAVSALAVRLFRRRG